MTFRHLADELLNLSAFTEDAVPSLHARHSGSLRQWMGEMTPDQEEVMNKEVQAARAHSRAPVNILIRADRWFADGIVALRYGYVCSPVNDDLHRVGCRILDKANASPDTVAERFISPIVERAYGLSFCFPGSEIPKKAPEVYRVVVELLRIARVYCSATPRCDGCPLQGSCAYYEYNKDKP